MATIGTMTIPLQDLAIRAVAHGGFTYRPQDGTYPAAGYAVSLPGHEERSPYLTDSVLALYVVNHAPALMAPGACLGAWLNDGEWYLDVTIVVDSELQALRLGVAWGQQAIYDLARDMPRLIPQWMAYYDAPDAPDAPDATAEAVS